jgi:hypothetical protein
MNRCHAEYGSHTSRVGISVTAPLREAMAAGRGGDDFVAAALRQRPLKQPSLEIDAIPTCGRLGVVYRMLR